MVHNPPDTLKFSSLARIVIQQVGGLSSTSIGMTDVSSSATLYTFLSNVT